MAPSPVPAASMTPAALTIGFVVSRPGEAVVTVTAVDAQHHPVPNVRIAFACNHHGTVMPHAVTSTADGSVHTTVTAVGRVTVTAHVTAPLLATPLKTTVTLTL